MEVQLGELTRYECAQRLSLDVLLSLDFAREHLTVIRPSGAGYAAAHVVKVNLFSAKSTKTDEE